MENPLPPSSVRLCRIPERRGTGRLTSALAGLALAGAGPAAADPEVQALALAAGAVALSAVFVDREVHTEPDYLTLEAGRFDPVNDVQQASALGAEYRSRQIVWWKLRPFAGAGFTSDRSLYGYGGARLAAYWGERFVITPSFAIAGYRSGDGKDLGDPPLVGRFGFDLEYALQGGTRVGLAYHHMSNGKVLGQTNNPGTEIVGLTVSSPLR